MLRALVCFALLLCCSISLRADEPQPIRVEPTDWPWWRGPGRNGTAIGDKYPEKWSETESVRWKAAIPGKGHGSPIVVGKQVVLLTAVRDPDQQWVLSFDRETEKSCGGPRSTKAGSSPSRTRKARTQTRLLRAMASGSSATFSATMRSTRRLWISREAAVANEGQ